MTDPLSITASVITVAALAYSSGKALYDTIAAIRDAPQAFIYLKTDVATLCQTMDSLQRELEKGKNVKMSNVQMLNLQEIKPVFEACCKASDEFKGKIDRVMCHSTDGRTSLRDRLKLQFQEQAIAAFQARLASYKSTFTIALELCTFKTVSENLDAVKCLETKIEDVTAHLTGQIQGLQIGLEAIRDADAEGRELARAESQHQTTKAGQREVLDTIEQQRTALSHCYQACMAAFKATTKATGHDYKYVKASNQARLLMGDLGNVQGGALHKYDNIEVDGGYVVAGNMSADFAKDFFK